MRFVIFGVLTILIVILGFCAKASFQSHKTIGRSVALLIIALFPPVIGNAIIIISGDQTLSTVGYYLFFLGMNCVMAALINFTYDYCMISEKRKKYKILVYALLGIDAVQMLCNLIWGHAFQTEMIQENGFPYYRMIPLAGQTFHRVVNYGVLAVVILIFFFKMIHSARINMERYSVILLTMIVTTIWESFYIFSRTPVDRSMIGFGFFGVLVFFFSIKYRPMRLLDSILAHIASELPEALFFFDSNEKCIWANKLGDELLGIENEDYEVVPERLRKLYGNYKSDQAIQHEARVDGQTKCHVVERHEITDEQGRLTGSFVSVRDNTAEQKTLREEVFKATHDPLTDVYNRAGYNLLISRMEFWKTIMLLIDGDCFKSVNDTYGHETGDKVLQKIANTVKQHFRSEDYVCRIGGDEFVVLMTHSESDQKEQIIRRINHINKTLSEGNDQIPPVTVSVGIAHGRNATDAEDFFKHADLALYETKNNGKNGYTFYEDLVPEEK